MDYLQQVVAQKLDGFPIILSHRPPPTINGGFSWIKNLPRLVRTVRKSSPKISNPAVPPVLVVLLILIKDHFQHHGASRLTCQRQKCQALLHHSIQSRKVMNMSRVIFCDETCWNICFALGAVAFVTEIADAWGGIRLHPSPQDLCHAACGLRLRNPPDLWDQQVSVKLEPQNCNSWGLRISKFHILHHFTTQRGLGWWIHTLPHQKSHFREVKWVKCPVKCHSINVSM